MTGKRTHSTPQRNGRPKFHKPNMDPMLVKLALGSIIIVGDMIEYLQRVQIQNSATSPTTAVTLNPWCRSHFGVRL